VILPEKRVAANQSVAGTLVLDFQKDPTYTGGLLLSAEATTAEPTPRKAFTIRLSADVK
jgi:hypothetical protein